MYHARGFKVITALMDREFEPLRGDLTDITLNTKAADEHVIYVERQIRVLKERARAVRSTLPFKRLPARMIIELIGFVTLWLNDFPPKSGVLDTFRPRTIMTGTSLSCKQNCKVPFGVYVETHEENNPSNTMVERTRGSICLGPSSNSQGSYTFFCLRTCHKITRKQFKELQMPDSLIKHIEAIAKEDKRSGNMIFCDKNCNVMPDDGAAYDDGLEQDITVGVDDDDDDDPSNNGGPFNSNNPPGIILESDVHEEQAETAEIEEIPAILHEDGVAQADSAASEEIDKISGVADIIEETPGVDLGEETPGVNISEEYPEVDDNDEPPLLQNHSDKDDSDEKKVTTRKTAPAARHTIPTAGHHLYSKCMDCALGRDATIVIYMPTLHITQ
jgi:hypothetical protein